MMKPSDVKLTVKKESDHESFRMEMQHGGSAYGALLLLKSLRQKNKNQQLQQQQLQEQQQERRTMMNSQVSIQQQFLPPLQQPQEQMYSPRSLRSTIAGVDMSTLGQLSTAMLSSSSTAMLLYKLQEQTKALAIVC